MELKRYEWKGRWTGINVFPITCFTTDLKVDYEAQRALFRHLVNSGVSGMGINGHTGEGEALTIEEQKNIIKIAQEEVKGRIPISTGIHAHNYEQGTEIAKEMEKTGVDLIMILAPSMYNFDARETPDYGIEYHKAIAKAVNIPVVMHQVYGTHDEYPTEAFAKMFQEIDNLVAVKLANSRATLAKFEKDIRAVKAIGRDHISLFSGAKHFYTFLWGLDGAFTGHAVFDCERLIALYNAAKQGNVEEAKSLRDQIYILEDVLYVPPMVNLITRYKEVSHMLGLIPSAAVRPPKIPLSEQERKKLRAALERDEFLPRNKLFRKS